MWKKWISRIIKHQSELSLYAELDPEKIPKHVAIIMDGNGRWAIKRGMPRTFGHQAGADTLHEILRPASDIGVKVLTCYAFSTENWRRPNEEVGFIMQLFLKYIDKEFAELDQNNVKIIFSGDIVELDQKLYQKFINAQQKTANNTGIVLNLAVNYGARAELVRAVKQIAEKVAAGIIASEEINANTIDQHLYTAGLPEPDLLIRPSGDFRLSNFLLWQCAYTEFWFTDINLPDFNSELFIKAIKDFQSRDRRFGGLNKSK